MTPETIEKRITVMQYINTIILTAIGIFAFMIFTTVRDIGKEQEIIVRKQFVMETEDLRLKTTQDRNVSDIAELAARVTVLETNYLDKIKDWIDANYVRKVQR